MKYVVESPAYNQHGVRVGTYKIEVATEKRAKELAAQKKDCSYRKLEE